MGPKMPKLLANETLYQLSYDPNQSPKEPLAIASEARNIHRFHRNQLNLKPAEARSREKAVAHETGRFSA